MPVWRGTDFFRFLSDVDATKKIADDECPFAAAL